MNNFFRALKLALRYRWNVAAAVVCALLVAVLWGGNIGTVYPRVEVTFQGESLQHWAQEKVDKAQQKIGELKQTIHEAEAELTKAPQSDRRAIENRRDSAAVRLDAEQLALRQYHW